MPTCPVFAGPVTILKFTCVFNNKLTYISTYFKREQEKNLLITAEVWWVRRLGAGTTRANKVQTVRIVRVKIVRKMLPEDLE